MNVKPRKCLAALLACAMCFALGASMLLPAMAADEIVELKTITPAPKEDWQVNMTTGRVEAGRSYNPILPPIPLPDMEGKIATATYALGKNYSKLTGKIAAAPGTSENCEMTVKIFCCSSATPLYVSKVFGKDTAIFDINVGDLGGVSLAGVENLTIELHNELTDSDPADTAIAYLTELKLTKAPDFYAPVDDFKDVYEFVNGNGSSKVPPKFVLAADPTKAEDYELIKVGDKYYALYLKNDKNDVYVAVKADGTFKTGEDCDAIWAGPDGKFEGGAGDDEKLTFKTDGYYYKKSGADEWTLVVKKDEFAKADHYVKVDGWKNVWEFKKFNGLSSEPPKFVLAADPNKDGIIDYELFLKDGKYYALYLKNDKNDVYVAVNKKDGTFDLDDAVWAGPDKKFNTADDKKADKKSDGYYDGSTLLCKLDDYAKTDHYVKVEGWKNVWEFVNFNGSSKDPRKFFLAEDPTKKIDYELFKKGDKFYAQYSKNDVYAALKKDGTFDLEDVIWAGKDKKFGTDDDFEAKKREDGYYYKEKEDGDWIFLCKLTDLFSADYFKPVEGWKNVYELVDYEGKSKDPKKFVLAADIDKKVDYELFQRGEKFYAKYIKNDVYVAVKKDGGFDLDDAIWAGPDKKFGTEDDVVATRRNGKYYYKDPETGELVFLANDTDLVNGDDKPVITPPEPDPEPPVKTGRATTAAMAVSMVLLLLGGSWAGYRWLRQRREHA